MVGRRLGSRTARSVALVALLATTGCITQGIWEWSRGGSLEGSVDPLPRHAKQVLLEDAPSDQCAKLVVVYDEPQGEKRSRVWSLTLPRDQRISPSWVRLFFLKDRWRTEVGVTSRPIHFERGDPSYVVWCGGEGEVLRRTQIDRGSSHINWRRVAAVSLTPITVALDVATAPVQLVVELVALIKLGRWFLFG